MLTTSLFATVALAATALAQNSTNSTAFSLKVAGSGGNSTSPLQYGIMFEDINHSGDGGIYAEMIQNRAFQGDAIFPSNLNAWHSVDGAALTLQNTSNPLSAALPTSMNVAYNKSAYGLPQTSIGFYNDGWWGFEVQPKTYTGSFWVYGAYSGSFKASLQSYLTKDVWATANITSHSVAGSWTQHNFTLQPTTAAPNVNNTFSITFDPSGVKDGSLNFNLISLFPPTYKNRPNGMRVDLMEALAGLTPSFLRMPGGNNIEGNDPPYRWYWNQTIGPLKDRPGYSGTWGYENTNGLGLVEYLHWCIDLNMEPILALWAGFYLSGPVTPENELGPIVQEALDELDFIMGPTSTPMGALREQLGYGAEPIYEIKYVEIGNEDNLGGGEGSYVGYRYKAFYDAIHTRWPDITIVASTVEITLPSTHAAGDYHQYTRPDYFVSQYSFFDHNASYPQTLIGEYATVQPNIAAGGGVNWNAARSPWPFWIGTVAEAVFLIGAERNSDAILGASYAPLLQNLNSYEWAPDLISFTADYSQDVLSTSYHMIKLLSNTRFAHTLPASTTNSLNGPVYFVAGEFADGRKGMKAAVYNSTGVVPMSIAFEGCTEGQAANLTVLTAPDGDSYNSVGSDVVKSSTSVVRAKANGVFEFGLPNLSIALLETE